MKNVKLGEATSVLQTLRCSALLLTRHEVSASTTSLAHFNVFGGHRSCSTRARVANHRSPQIPQSRLSSYISNMPLRFLSMCLQLTEHTIRWFITLHNYTRSATYPNKGRDLVAGVTIMKSYSIVQEKPLALHLLN